MNRDFLYMILSGLVTVAMVVLCFFLASADSGGFFSNAALVLTILAAIATWVFYDEVKKAPQKAQMKEYEKDLVFDKKYDYDDFYLYVNSEERTFTFCKPIPGGVDKKVVEDIDFEAHWFGEIRDASYQVYADSTHAKVVRAWCEQDMLIVKEFDQKAAMEAVGIDTDDSEVEIKVYDRYAFIFDEGNQCLTLISPDKIAAFRYIDIVSFTFMEGSYTALEVMREKTTGDIKLETWRNMHLSRLAVVLKVDCPDGSRAKIELNALREGEVLAHGKSGSNVRYENLAYHATQLQRAFEEILQ